MIRKDVASSHWPPKVIVPRQISETTRPVRPIRRCCIIRPPQVRSLDPSMATPGIEDHPLIPWRTLLVMDTGFPLLGCDGLSLLLRSSSSSQGAIDPHRQGQEDADDHAGRHGEIEAPILAF